MRNAAQSVGVSWDEQAIAYQDGYIGYENSPENIDPTALQDELESRVGVRPSVQE
jgi:hypothetical protein